jgi:simple sugar transport system permease protein
MGEVLSISLVISGIYLSAPLLFAAFGGLLAERAGVVNIALEGQMLFGAFTGVAVAWWLDSHLLGMAAALAVGAIVGGVLAAFSVTIGANQIVSATAINLIAFGLTAALIEPVWGQPGSSPSVSKFGRIDIPVLGDLPVVGRIFTSLTIVEWAAIALAPVVWIVLFRTAFGLRLRACGEDPHAAASVGVRVRAMRYQAVIWSGVLAAAGGAYLSLVQVGAFQRGMTQGRGFLALAAMIFGKWRPVPVLGACVLFGVADAFQLRAQAVGVDLPHELMIALPYVVALVALATFVGRASAPAAIGKPFVDQ